MDPIIVPPELFDLAKHPALPASAAVVNAGKDQLGRTEIKLFPPSGGHTLLDAYAMAIAAGVYVVDALESVSDAELDKRYGRAVWRLALSMLRTRPDLRTPSGLPEKGLETR